MHPDFDILHTMRPRLDAALALLLGLCTLGIAQVAWADQPKDVLAQRCQREDWAACLELGVKLEYRSGDARDRRKAAAIYKRTHRALEKGCQDQKPEDCLLLASMHALGRGRARDRKRAWELRLKACKHGATSVCHHLARLYRRGYHYLDDDSLAADVLQQRAEAIWGEQCSEKTPTSEACFTLALKNAPRFESVRPEAYLQKHCRGQGVCRLPKSPALTPPRFAVRSRQQTAQAELLLDRGCQAGAPRFCLALLRMRDSSQGGGFGQLRLALRARKLYAKQCEDGAPGACVMLSTFYQGDLVGSPQSKQQKWLMIERRAELTRAACRQGDPASCLNSGQPEKGQRLLKDACKDGEPKACYQLHRSLRFANGSEQELIRHAQAGCNLGQAGSCSVLLLAHEYGRLGLPKNPARAKHLRRRYCKLSFHHRCLAGQDDATQRALRPFFENACSQRQIPEVCRALLMFYRYNPEKDDEGLHKEEVKALYQRALAKHCREGSSEHCTELMGCLRRNYHCEGGQARAEQVFRSHRQQLRARCRSGAREGCRALISFAERHRRRPGAPRMLRQARAQACAARDPIACRTIALRRETAVTEITQDASIWRRWLEVHHASQLQFARCLQGSAIDCEKQHKFSRLRLIQWSAERQRAASLRALDLFDKRCRAGEVDSCLWLPTLADLARLDEPNDYPQRILSALKTACRQDGWACLRLAKIQAPSTTKPLSSSKAFKQATKLLSTACSKGEASACMELRVALDEMERASSARPLRVGCDAGSALACHLLAQKRGAISRGATGPRENIRTWGKPFQTILCDRGQWRPCEQVGRKKRSKKLLKDACKAGDAEACLRLAERSSRGERYSEAWSKSHGDPKHPAWLAAKKIWKRDCKAGDPEACLRLAEQYSQRGYLPDHPALASGLRHRHARLLAERCEGGDQASCMARATIDHPQRSDSQGKAPTDWLEALEPICAAGHMPACIELGKHCWRSTSRSEIAACKRGMRPKELSTKLLRSCHAGEGKHCLLLAEHLALLRDDTSLEPSTYLLYLQRACDRGEACSLPDSPY